MFSPSTYIDLFGGSGLLSNTVKEVYPNAQVVYNDYDDFRGRLAAIPTTNQILADLRLILANEPRGKMIRKEVKQQVISCVERYDKLGNVHIYANNIDATKDLLTGSDGVKFSLNV